MMVALRRIATPSLAERIIPNALMCLAATAAGLAITVAGSTDNQVKLFLLGIAAIAGLVGVARPSVLLGATVALAPLTYYVSALGLHVAINDALLVVAAVLVARHGATAVPRWVSVGGMLLVGGSAVAAATGAVDGGLAWWGAARWFCAMILLRAAWTCREAGRSSEQVTKLVSGAGIVVALGAVAQSVGWTALVGSPYLTDRLDSTFGYYTQFAAFMAIVIVVSGASFAATRTVRGSGRILYFAATVAAGVALVMSLSRGGVLAAGVGFTALLALTIKRPSQAIPAAVGVVVLLGIALFLAPASYKDRLIERLNPTAAAAVEVGAGNDRVRAMQQDKGRQLMAEHPSGIGYGNFRDHASGGGVLPHAHRTPVQIALDAGWLGLAGYGLLFGGPIVIAIRLRRSGPLPLVVAAPAAALAGLWAQGWYDYLYYETGWLVLQVVLVWLWLSRADDLRSTRSEPVNA
jgi:hypothetical protein